MRWLIHAGASVACIAGLGACGTGQGPDSSVTRTDGVQVEAHQDVLITNDPLGDVVMGELTAGETATAVCFFADAQTNTGAEGSAAQSSRAGSPAMPPSQTSPKIPQTG